MGKYFQMLSMVFTMGWTEATPFTTWMFNESGVKALIKGDKAMAYTSLTRALDGDALNPRVQLNLGLAFELNEEFDKAATTYEGVLTLLPKDDAAAMTDPHEVMNRGLDAPTFFNLGNARAQAKNIPAAVAAYQSAFDLGADPQAVKTNIELLFQNGDGDGGKGQSKNESKDQKESKDKDQKKDDRTNQEKREDSLKKPEPDKDKDKGKPKPFQSQELTPADVKRILDEIKNQEQSIRAQENDKQPKDAARGGKDW